MNSVPNSDSEQRTESKLGWVHQVHTLAQPARTGHAHCAVSWCALGCIVAHMGPFRDPLPIMSQESPVVSLRARARWWAVSQRGCRIAGRVATHPSSQASAYHDTTDCIVTHSPAARPLSPVTIKYLVSRHSPPARPCARALSAVSWPPLAVSWPVSTVSWA